MDLLIFYSLLLLLAVNGIYGKVNEEKSPEKPCIPGKVYKHACNICTCQENYTLVCSKNDCNDKNKKLGSGDKESKEKTTKKETKHDTTTLKTRPVKSNSSHKCTPGKVYKEGNHLCFCVFNGKLRCSDEIVPKSIVIDEIHNLEKVFPSVEDEEYANLPTLPHIASSCKPGEVYRVECDVCACKEDGDLLCTDRLCLPQEGINRKQAARLTGQPCSVKKELKNVCVNCTCTKKVLQCSPVPACKPVLRQLHGPLSHKDTFLDPTSEKCPAKETIKAKCNICQCAGSRLFCTRMLCIPDSKKKKMYEILKKSPFTHWELPSNQPIEYG